MTLDIRGGRKNTAINHSHYVVFEEMLSNAIDSYLVRRNSATTVPPFHLKIDVEVFGADLFDDSFDVEVNCEDNGIGFGDQEVKAFVTKDTTYKDQLQIPGIGKCKGAGRIQYFHHFDQLRIDSVFVQSDKTLRRTLDVFESSREISEDSFTLADAEGEDVRTRLSLKRWRHSALTEEQRAELGTTPEIFFADAVSDHLYTALLQRLITLKRLTGNFKIEISSSDGEKKRSEIIDSDNLPEPIGQAKELALSCVHSKDERRGPPLRVTRYSFPALEFPNFQHEIALCANSVVVQSITRHYLKHASDRKRPNDGNFELLLVENDLLEEKVNQQRDGFDIPIACTENETLSKEFSLEDVVNSLEDYVFQIITPSDFDKEALVMATEQKFGITRQMIEGASVKIHYGDSEENIARRVLRKLQDDIVGDTSRLFKLKDELLQLDSRTPDFRAKVSELSWKYASSIKKMDMTNLSQLVVRRSAMIEILRLAIAGLLTCQAVEPGKRNANERIIHNIFFPMGKDSTETAEHDIWLLNEEYQYFEYICSDKSLKAIKWSDQDTLFEPDIDESLEKLFAENNTNHEGKRPDIAVFTKEGAAIIIEFKAPDVGLQEHLPDLAQYARLLAAKSNGRLKKFYGYLIGCKVDATRMDLGYTRFANGKGYFRSDKLVDYDSGRAYGELYSEVLLYDHFIERADLRLRVYKEKLNVQMD